MSEDNKLQAIMSALKKSQQGGSGSSDSDDKKEAAYVHRESTYEEDNDVNLYSEDQGDESDNKDEKQDLEQATETSEGQGEQYDPLQIEESESDSDSEENQGSVEEEEKQISQDGSSLGDNDSNSAENEEPEQLEGVLDENDEKENDEEEDSSDSFKKENSSIVKYDDSSKQYENSSLGIKEQSITDKLGNVDNQLLQKQVKYILDSDMLSLPEFKELSAQEKVVAIITLLNSNVETAMPTKSVSPVVSDALSRRRFPRPDMSQSMTPEERQRYSEYLLGENRITEIEHFPPKSRLFIGNLPLKNVTKEDLFRIFSPYGHIFQINIKNAFGFIQYDNAQSVRDAIECESNESNFGKKLILEVSSSNSRPQFDHGDHGTNSSSTFVTSSKRPFDEQDDEDDMYSDNHYKKTKKRIPQCMILVKRTADRAYANEVFNNFRNGSDLETDMVFLKPKMELRKLINDAAYDGVWGVILVNKTRNVDIQSFYKGPQGETKFDEYISVSCEDSIAIFNNLKNTRAAGGSISPHLQQRGPLSQQRQQKQQHLQSQPQPQPQPQPQQQYYGAYGMQSQQPPYMPPQQMFGPMAAVPPPPPPPPPPQQRQQYPAMQSYGTFAPQQLPMAASGQANSPMDQSQLLAAIQHLPQNVISSLLSMAQQQPNQQQQVLGLIQQLQNNPQGQQAAQQLAGTMGYPYAGYGAASQTPPVMAGSPPPQQHQLPPQQQPPAQQQQQKHQPVPQPQSNQPGSSVQSLLDSLAQLQK
ncbi:HER065Wp [Eremothecium sinecaudum]|uniref:HER065Wp n=1 Tax=Eremothecium sinecaudum TaxID=45286 RepID=A0A0X8HTS6_9SACH|nr:HER065Wp [Eremothecium sinecaudum]AMD21344.1 HER065Wp [Eremothecium sinecaudum]